VELGSKGLQVAYDVLLDACDVRVAQRAGEASLDDVEIDLGRGEQECLSDAARCIRFTREVRGPHAHRHEARCVGTPRHLHAKAERVCAGRSRGLGGDGECVGLVAARTERDVDLGRLDRHPGRDLELEPAGKELLGVVARQHLELDLILIGLRLWLERLRQWSTTLRRRLTACLHADHTRPGAKGDGRDDGRIEVADTAGEGAPRDRRGSDHEALSINLNLTLGLEPRRTERMRAVPLRRPVVGVLSGWLDQPVGRAEPCMLRDADHEGLFGGGAGPRSGGKRSLAVRLRLTVRRDMQPHGLDLGFDPPEVPKASLDFERLSRDHVQGAASALQS
jgi:hypothetical protein